MYQVPGWGSIITGNFLLESESNQAGLNPGAASVFALKRTTRLDRLR